MERGRTGETVGEGICNNTSETMWSDSLRSVRSEKKKRVACIEELFDSQILGNYLSSARHRMRGILREDLGKIACQDSTKMHKPGKKQSKS